MSCTTSVQAAERTGGLASGLDWNLQDRNLSWQLLSRGRIEDDHVLDLGLALLASSRVRCGTGGESDRRGMV